MLYGEALKCETDKIVLEKLALGLYPEGKQIILSEDHIFQIWDTICNHGMIVTPEDDEQTALFYRDTR